jgi:SAM-dependent methyltransferase
MTKDSPSANMPDRKQHWENVYQQKSPHEVSWFQENPSLSLQLIQRCAIAKDAALIDVGGGASTLVDKLNNEGYTNITVLDVSEHALDHSKARLADKAKTVEWFAQDITCFEPPHKFALWHDRAVFHFLTSQADRQKYIDVLKQALEPGGFVIIMAFATDGPVKCSGLDVVQYDAEKLMAELGPGFDLLETGHDVHDTPTGNQQKFAYFRLSFNGEAF